MHIMNADGNGSFPFVMVGGVLEAKTRWNIGKEVTNSILKIFPGACPIIPKVEPVIGAALLGYNLLMREGMVVNDGHR